MIYLFVMVVALPLFLFSVSSSMAMMSGGGRNVGERRTAPPLPGGSPDTVNAKTDSPQRGLSRCLLSS